MDVKIESWRDVEQEGQDAFHGNRRPFIYLERLVWREYRAVYMGTTVYGWVFQRVQRSDGMG